MAVPQLVLGAFNLTDWLGVTYNTHVIAEGTSKGAPVPLEVAVQSWLQDGSVVVTQGYDNRTVTLRVKFRGPSLTAVATAEAAFFAELGKPNTLTWTPASGPATVFVVVTSSMEESPGEDGDLAENQAFPWRTYNVSLTCEAFTRSAAEVSAPVLPTSGSTTTSLDAMGATTGWTATVDGVTATVVNAAGPPTTNSVSSSATTASVTVVMQKTFAATTTSTKMLIVDWQSSVSGNGTLTAVGDGVALPVMAEVAAPTLGFIRSYFYVAAASLAVTKLQWVSGQFVPSGARTLTVDNVAVTNIPPSTGTLRQRARSLTITGSAPSQGSLSIQSPTTALGNGTLVYVFPTRDANGYSPSLRQYRIAGNTVTTDSTKVSGSTEPMTGSGITFQVPLNLLPSGSYILMARVGVPSGAASGTLTTLVGTMPSATSIPLGPVTMTSTVSLGTTYQTLALGRLNLPTVDTPVQTGGYLYLNLLATGWSLTPTLDELWLFNTTLGQLTHVNCGTGSGSSGGSARRLWFAPANVTTPRPSLLMGHAADGSDAFYPVSPSGVVYAWQSPKFPPPQVNVLAVTPNATDAVIALSYYPRWHTNASS